MHKVFYTVLIIFSFAKINAMDWQNKESMLDPSIYQQYCGKELNPESILELADPMPKNIQSFFDEWTNDNKNFLDKTLPPNSKIDISKKNDSRYTTLFQSDIRNFGYLNESELNAALPIMISTEKFYFKYAGLLRRAWNLEATLKRDTSLKQSDEVLTFQTVTQIPVILRLKECIQKEKITGIKIPKTYLGIIRDRLAPVAHDYNTILVQEEMVGFKPLYLQTKELETISQKTVDDLIKLIEVGPIFDITVNLLFNPKTKELGLCDLELDWKQPAQDFFNKNQEAIKQTVADSISGLLNLAKEAGEDAQPKSGRSFLEKLYGSVYYNPSLLKKLDHTQLEKIGNAYDQAEASLFCN
ncbi:MAG TPA: hypothetical protein VHO47_05210 [Candidatus Babeliales bacterium]|nr:hypothetical protein [Candidatus Babeliales bacterium]